MVLVPRFVDHRYLALPKGVVQRVVDLADGKPEARRGGTVDDQIGLERPLFLVEMDIGQQQQLFQRSLDFGRPLVELVIVFAMQRVLILGAAYSTSDTNILNRSKIRFCPLDLVE